MTLKQKSIGILMLMAVFFVTTISLVVFWVMTVSFQKIEIQAVEKNIRRIQIIIDNYYVDLNNKIMSWSIWDDTYEFLSDGNKKYIDSYITNQDSFNQINIDEILFINKKGALVSSFLSDKVEKEVGGFPDNLYRYFATESAVLKIDKEIGFNKGLVKGEDGVLFFVIREVFKSDGSGEPNGYLVFAKYFDDRAMVEMRNLTQFDLGMFYWDDPKMSTDYQEIKEAYIKDKITSQIKPLNNQTISGYLVIKDILGEPVGIVRSDISREIYIQGLRGTVILIGILILSALLIIIIDYSLLVGVVLNKIILLSEDVHNFKTLPEDKLHLKVYGSGDEVDRLRNEINSMLVSFNLEKSESESILDVVNSLVIVLNTEALVLKINAKGLEVLGYASDKEVLGKDWFRNFVPEEQRQSVSEKFNSLLSGNTINLEVEHLVLKKSGETILVHWVNTVIKNAQGKITSILKFGEDITMKREEEIKKEEYSRELERLNSSMVGREIKMIELKNEIKRLKNTK